jgi:uracil DNA glycosylase
MSILKNDWAPLLEEEFEKPYSQQLRKVLQVEYETKSFIQSNRIFIMYYTLLLFKTQKSSLSVRSPIMALDRLMD